MNLLGFLLTAAGFLGGAFLTSLDPEQVRWGFFVPCMLVGAVGVYLIKTSSLQARAFGRNSGQQSGRYRG